MNPMTDKQDTHRKNRLLAELEAAVRAAQDEARALVVFGHGPCFSAGLDLTEHQAREPADVLAFRA